MIFLSIHCPRYISGLTKTIILFFLFFYFTATFTSAVSISDFGSYTGSVSLIDDGNNTYRIRFLTSGTFVPKINLSADVFLVGGGGAGGQSYDYHRAGGGGGGGYVRNATVSLTAGSSYNIVIGNGGAANSASGGTSTAFGYSAAGGGGGSPAGHPVGGHGGSGGSGGGAGGANFSDSYGLWGYPGGAGGSNGAGGGGSWSQYNPEPNTIDDSAAAGRGAGVTTYEFGDSNKPLYAGGGGGGFNNYSGVGGAGGGGNGGNHATGTAPVAGSPNTGGGGGGGAQYRNQAGAAGGSGIVIIRMEKILDTTAPTISSITGTQYIKTPAAIVTASGIIDTGGSGLAGLQWAWRFLPYNSSTWTAWTYVSENNTASTADFVNLRTSEQIISTNRGSGRYQIAVRAYDAAGNYNNSWLYTNVYYDIITPTCTAWSPNPDVWGKATKTFTLSGCNDLGSSTLVGDSSKTCTVSTHGQSCSITVYDKSGNTTTYVSPTAKIDTISPTCTAWSPSLDAWGNSTKTFTLSGCTDAGGSGLIGDSYRTCSVTSHNNTCSIVVTDSGGNSKIYVSPVAKIDITPPSCGVGNWQSVTNDDNTVTFTLPPDISDDLSGIIASQVLTCQTTSSNNSCVITLQDNAGNMSQCESPKVTCEMRSDNISGLENTTLSSLSNCQTANHLSIPTIYTDGNSGFACVACIKVSDPWFQVVNGNLYANGDIKGSSTGKVDAYEVRGIDCSSNTDKGVGIPISSSDIKSLSSQIGNAKDINLSPGAVTVDKEDYDFFARSLGYLPEELEHNIKPCPSNLNSHNSNDFTKKMDSLVCYARDDLTLTTNIVVNNNEIKVIFINGNLTLKANTSVQSDGFLLFVVSGNIIIDPSLGHFPIPSDLETSASSSCINPDHTTIDLHGLFIADGTISIASGASVDNQSNYWHGLTYTDGSTSGAACNKKLTLKGSFIGWGQADSSLTVGTLGTTKQGIFISRTFAGCIKGFDPSRVSHDLSSSLYQSYLYDFNGFIPVVTFVYDINLVKALPSWTQASAILKREVP